MRVSFSECGVTVAALYLKAHMARILGMCTPNIKEVDEVGGGPTTYVVSFPRVLQKLNFPVTGCSLLSHSAGRI